MKNNIIEYAINSYSFVLPKNGEFSFKFWAEEIKKVYDSAGERYSAVISEIEKQGQNKTIIRRFGVNSVREEMDISK